MPVSERDERGELLTGYDGVNLLLQAEANMRVCEANALYFSTLAKAWEREYAKQIELSSSASHLSPLAKTFTHEGVELEMMTDEERTLAEWVKMTFGEMPEEYDGLRSPDSSGSFVAHHGHRSEETHVTPDDGIYSAMVE